MIAKHEESILGYGAHGEKISSYSWMGVSNFQEYILKFRTTKWQKFVAKYFKSVCLGFFKKADHSGHMGWFLLWCNRCQSFQVVYKQGHEGSLTCSCLKP